jgi:dienelactone hydrolase
MLLFLFVAASLSPAAPAAEVGPIYSVQTISGVPYGRALVNGGSGAKDLLLDVRLPVGNHSTQRPALVVIHGGAYTSGTRDDLGGIAKHFTERGFVTFCISYRLLGDNPPNGTASCIADARTAVRWVRANHAQYGVAPDAIGVLGHSAGAFTTVEIAIADASAYGCDMPEEPINNVGVSSAIQAAVEFSGGALNIAALDGGDAPLMIVHGMNDPVVWYGHALLLRNACVAKGLKHTFVSIPYWLHGMDPAITIVDGVGLYELMFTFLLDTLGPGSDRDGDGLNDYEEGAGNLDGDSSPNYLDSDSDGDGILDALEGVADVDGDGSPNSIDVDSDGDGLSDATEGLGDLDHDGLPNYLDADSDGDGLPDAVEGISDWDGDGLPNCLDPDSDGDGLEDGYDIGGDVDRDGLQAYADPDSEDDGLPDGIEGAGDMDGDGDPNYLDRDSDGDQALDASERLFGLNALNPTDGVAVPAASSVLAALAMALAASAAFRRG